MKISAVIPTRNRPDSLKRLLQSFQQQLLQAVEIIIVDASDDTSYHEALQKAFSDLPLAFIKSDFRSVCIQRNMGIKRASNEWIFLCDDDIEMPTDYLEKLSGYLTGHSECGAVAGRCLQLENGIWSDQYPPKSFGSLLWRYMFQTSVWSNLDNLKSPLKWVKAYYQQRGNTTTLAGWPLVTQWTESFSTSFFSLGANIINRDWLLQSPYDEVLDANGIGDNYGVALGFPGKIHVLSSTFVHHHVEKSNRLHESVSYYRRVLALHYFIKKSKKFPNSTERWLLWSLVGNTIKFIATFRLLQVWASLKAMALIVFAKNPYWIGFKKNQKLITPQLTFSKRDSHISSRIDHG